ncbi:MAG: hypothetical protein LIO77_06000 [Rikenellaceae bacterium]|nr:hypothetical protein [Rikenellaceae bacterium]
MNSPLYVLMAVITATVSSCQYSDNNRLVVETETCTISVGENTKIPITRGNGDYTITCGDENILMVGFCRTGKASGELLLAGLQEGEVMVCVTDNVTGDKAELKVEVAGPDIAQP